MTVRPGHLAGWVSLGLSSPPHGRWVTGPAPAPLGRGSARLTVNDILQFDPNPALDLSTLVARYETYGASPAQLVLIVNGATLTSAPSSGSPGWQSFDAKSNDTWEWDCGPDGHADGIGGLADFLGGGCAESQVTTVLLAPPGADSYVDAVRLGTGSASTIYDMEPGLVSVASVKKLEHDRGRTTMTFTVRLAGPNEDPVRIGFTTVNGTARAGRDYVAKHGTLTIKAGSVSGRIKVSIIGDRHDERNERFSVKLRAPVNAMFGDNLAIGTIVDDDRP